MTDYDTAIYPDDDPGYRVQYLTSTDTFATQATDHGDRITAVGVLLAAVLLLWIAACVGWGLGVAREQSRAMAAGVGQWEAQGAGAEVVEFNYGVRAK